MARNLLDGLFSEAESESDQVSIQKCILSYPYILCISNCIDDLDIAISTCLVSIFPTVLVS